MVIAMPEIPYVKLYAVEVQWVTNRILGVFILNSISRAMRVSHLIFILQRSKVDPRTPVILFLNLGSLNEMSRASCSQLICRRKFLRLSLFNMMTSCVKLVLTSLTKHRFYCSLN